MTRPLGSAVARQFYPPPTEAREDIQCSPLSRLRRDEAQLLVANHQRVLNAGLAFGTQGNMLNGTGPVVTESHTSIMIVVPSRSTVYPSNRLHPSGSAELTCATY